MGHSCRKAFTLIELLVVISIIALLMAVLLPSLQRAREQAKAVACMSNQKQWGIYFSLYTQDNNGRFHPGWNVAADKHWSWLIVLEPYYWDNPDLASCPAATKPRREGGTDPFGAWTLERDGKDQVGSYGINLWVTNPPQGREGGQPGAWYWRSGDVKNPSRIPLLVDNHWWDFRPHHTDQPPEYEGQLDGWSTNAMKYACQNRHNGKVNAVFLDFTVRSVLLKHLWRLKWHREYNLNGPLPKWPDWMQRFPDP